MEGVDRGQVKSGHKMDGIKDAPIFLFGMKRWVVDQKKCRLDVIAREYALAPCCVGVARLVGRCHVSIPVADWKHRDRVINLNNR